MRMSSAVLPFILTFSVLTLAGAPILRGQQSAVAPGTPVRFELRNGERYEGAVVSLGAEGLVAGVPQTGSTGKYPLSDIAKLEVSQGRRRPVLRDATIGFVGGASVGAILGALSYKQPDIIVGNRSDAMWLGAFLGGVPGLLIGGIVGLVPRDRWQRVNVDGNVVRLNMRTLPRSRTGIELALAF